MLKPSHPDQFISSCFTGIWLNEFIHSTESLERCFDAIAPFINQVTFDGRVIQLLDFFKFIKEQQIQGVRVHLPVSGATDGLIDNGEYLDLALEIGQAISLLGNRNFVLIPQEPSWHLFEISRPAKLPIVFWKDSESEFTNFLLSIGDHLEAFDLIAKNEEARDVLINLDHIIKYLEFPENQPHKITELFGRLMRTLAIGLLAKAAWVPSASVKKNQLYLEKVEEIITRSRAFLSQVANYAYKHER